MAYGISCSNLEKKNVILFPHRIAPEKQLEIFEDLAKHLPQYDFVVCQNKKLTKHEYHTLLGQSKLVFSANLQETLGISWYEGVMVDAIPMVPDRLSYSEMAISEFKYPSEWTSSYESYIENREKILEHVDFLMTNYENLQSSLQLQKEKLMNDFFSGRALYEVIRRKHNG